ncbi:MAG: glycosyltransferase family 39 protein [Chloroflexi bacterium]|nr:glycosyltransferase family 39 protein [Chloroflexota bacterium]
MPVFSDHIQSSFLRKYKNYFWVLVALLVGLALRVVLLDSQSLWNDEGTSVALSSLSIEAITNGAAHDIHPPLYYYFLHFWMLLVGQSEFAVRFLSVIAGVLTVAFTYRIASHFFDGESAVFAVFFVALSPFLVYYSQEARMYIWVTLFGVMSVYAMTQMYSRVVSRLGRSSSASPVASPTSNIQPPTSNSRWKRSLFWFLYIASTIALLYTQYVGAFVVVAQNLAFVVWLGMAWRDKRPHIKHSVALWIAAQIIIGLAFLPWFLFAGGQLATWPSISEPFDLPTLIWNALNVFSLGESGDASLVAIAVTYGILLLIGCERENKPLGNWGIVTLLLLIFVPVGIMYVVSLSRPAYNPKFLLLASPAFAILVGRGLARIHPGTFLHGRPPLYPSPVMRQVFMLLSIVAAVGFVPPLKNYYFDPKYARDDYRSIVRFIDANAREGDSILVDAPGQVDVVKYYHRGTQSMFLLPRMRPLDAEKTRADVDDMLAKSKRLFAIYYATQQSDPQAIIENRLAERAFKARDEWHGDVRLAVYGVANSRSAPQSMNAKVGNDITLASYQLDSRQARVGDVLALILNWRADQTPSTRNKVFVHLLSTDDQVVAQRDGEPVSDTRLTTTWRAGETIADNYGVMIDPGTPPGEYRIEIGMYRADDGTRLRVGDADHLILGTVQIK